MRLLFKFYLLGQLIALPFMVGAIGNALGGGSDSAYVPPRTEIAASSTFGAPTLGAPAIANTRDHCAALENAALNPVQDDLQQLRYITAELYGEEAVEDCWSK